MFWMWMVVVGLTGETWLIIALARPVTSRYEAEAAADRQWPLTGGSRDGDLRRRGAPPEPEAREVA